MKRFLFIIILIAVTLTLAACGSNDANPGERLILGPVEAAEGFITFIIHNDSGSALYYRDNFRVYRDNHGEWELFLDRSEFAGTLNRIEAGANRAYFIMWPYDPATSTICMHCVLQEGSHRFIRPLYSDSAGNNEVGRHEFEFEVEQPIPPATTPEESLAEYEIFHEIIEQRLFEMLDFVMQVYPGRQLIVPIGDVQISETQLRFSKENTSEYDFTFSHHAWTLAIYQDGRWQPLLLEIPARSLRAMQGGWAALRDDLPAGAITNIVINFKTFYHELAPGRYMLIQNYGASPQPEHALDLEWMFIEFEITEDTRAHN
jgi:hypothetical protein